MRLRDFDRMFTFPEREPTLQHQAAQTYKLYIKDGHNQCTIAHGYRGPAVKPGAVGAFRL